jgi:hypothetical protein
MAGFLSTRNLVADERTLIERLEAATATADRIAKRVNETWATLQTCAAS